MKRLRFLSLICALGLAAACDPGPRPATETSAAPPASPTPVLVSAAASLQDALEAIAPEFEAAYPAIALTYNFGSSGALQQQIEQGAPVDVFISAGVKQMDALEAKALIRADSRRNLLGNRLVLVVPQTSALGLADFDDLSQAGVERIAVGEFRTVPAGQYAEQVLSNLGLLATVQPKLVFANNVRGVLTAVELGDADAGLVYATDAATSEQVTVVTTADPALHDPITYPLALLQAAPQPEAAQTFVDYLLSDPAQATFQEFGFTPPH